MLGILAINIASFAAGEAAGHSPDRPQPGSTADHIAFFVNLVLFEGKMRALFSVLFGASLLLFIERADAAGRDGARLQLRRLGWLMLFGFLHFALIWDGDILFLYGAIGLVALGFRHLAPGQKVVAALLALALWQAFSTIGWISALADENAVRTGDVSKAEITAHAAVAAQYRELDDRRRAEVTGSWVNNVATRMADRPAYPLELAFYNWGETLAYVLVGMALLQFGFFTGQLPAPAMRAVAILGLLLGGCASLAFAVWAEFNRYPDVAMRYWTGYGLAFVRLAMALGYAAVLVQSAARILKTRLGLALEAAGRMAFSNYLGTSLVMTALFHGWGLGLFGRSGPATRWCFVLAAWLVMLVWSSCWLARFRQGPMERIWRSLTEWQAPSSA